HVSRARAPTPFPYTTLFRSDLLVVPRQPFRQVDIEVGAIGIRILARHDGDRAHALEDQQHQPFQHDRAEAEPCPQVDTIEEHGVDRKSTRLNSSHVKISYAV